MSVITPVQYKIPSSLDEEVYNILSFSGIDCSENPFVMSSGSATDLKNLYINDEGTLSTRPRLNFERYIDVLGEVIDRLSLNDDTEIIIGRKDGSTKIWSLSKSESYEPKRLYVNSVNISDYVKNDITVFKNSEGVVFLACKAGLFYLEGDLFENVQNSDKAYIPTTKQGKLLNDPNTYTEYEDFNLLTNKYKETYFFDLYNSQFNINNYNLNWNFENVFSVSKKTYDNSYGSWPMQVFLENSNGDSVVILGNSRDSIGDVENPVWAISKKGSSSFVMLENFKDQSWIDVDLKNVFFNEPKQTPSKFILSNDGNEIYKIDVSIDSDNVTINYTVKKINVNEKKYYDNVFTKTAFYKASEQISQSSVSIENVQNTDHDFYILLIYKTQTSGVTDYILGYWNDSLSTDGFLMNSVSSETEYQTRPNVSFYYDTSTGFIWAFCSKVKSSGDQKLLGFSAKYSDGNFFKTTESIITYTYTADIINDGVVYPEYVENGIWYLMKNKNWILYSYSTKLSIELNNLKILNSPIVVYPIPISGSKNLYLATAYSDKNIIYFWGDITSSNTYPVKIYEEYTDVFDPSTIQLDGQYNIDFSGTYSYYNQESNFTWIYKSLNGDSIRLDLEYKTENSKIPNLYTISELEKENDFNFTYTAYVVFDNKFWFYRGYETEHKNYIRYTKDMSCWYLPENNYDDIGDSDEITAMVQVSNTYLGVFKKKDSFLIYEDEETPDLYYVINLKTKLGNYPPKQAIVSTYVNSPMVINENGIMALKQTESVVTGDDVFVSLSDKISPKLTVLKNKENIITHNHRYWTYFILPEQDKSTFWVLDNRSFAWFYWELPITVSYIYEDIFKGENVDDTLTYVYSTDGKLYSLTNTIYYLKSNDDKNNTQEIKTYQDYMGDKTFKRIEWRWKSIPLTLNIINYIKKITTISFLFADRDRELQYDVLNNKYTTVSPSEDKNLQMLYTFKAYRKKSKFLNSQYYGQIDYVKNLKIRPRLQKCDFIELELSNRREDDYGNIIWTYEDYMPDVSSPDNRGGNILDKFNLIGITFRMTVSEGA